jgi:hypothetical protein
MKNLKFVFTTLSLIGISFLIFILSCTTDSKFGTQVNNFDPQTWFEAVAKTDNSVALWQQNQVVRIDWGKALLVKDIFGHECWEIPVATKRKFAYEYEITHVNGKELQSSERLRSNNKIVPFSERLFIVKNGTNSYSAKIVQYSTPYPELTGSLKGINLNNVNKNSQLNLYVSELSGRIEYGLYFGQEGAIQSITSPSLDIYETLITKVAVAESCEAVKTQVNTGRFQSVNDGSWQFLDTQHQYHIDYICNPTQATAPTPPPSAPGVNGEPVTVSKVTMPDGTVVWMENIAESPKK